MANPAGSRPNLIHYPITQWLFGYDGSVGVLCHGGREGGREGKNSREREMIENVTLPLL
jgi:hypothetical protein